MRSCNLQSEEQSERRSFWLRLAVCVCLFALSISGAFAGTKRNPDVDTLFARWDAKDVPGAAVVIVHNGAVVYQRGYGCGNLETRTPITPQTVFDVASVAKQFTGLAVAMLMEQGKLSGADDIRKYVPEVPDFGSRITIDELVHHTSGLRDWPETLGLAGVGAGQAITLETIMTMVHRQRELDF